MAGEDAIEIEGAVMEALANGTYRVQLANGHVVLAYVAGKARLSFARLTPGARVKLQMSPYDLSEGRIVVETQKQ